MGKDGLGTFSPNNIRSYELGSTLGGLGSFVTLQNFENININNGGFGGTIIASNLDNIITVTNATQKTISYQHAISGVKVNLSTDLTDPNTTNVSGGSGNDRIVGFSNVNGSAFNDEITGDNTNNLLNGGAGADRIDGKGGNDTVSYSDSSSAVNVDLRITSAQSNNNNGHASGDTLINIEHITGSSFNDNLIANNDAVQNILSGGNGDDTLRGFANDILYGQNGNDTFNINLSSLPNLIWGEAGNDTIKVEGITTANAAGMFASLSGGRSFQNEVINVRDGATHTFNIDAGTIQNIVDAGVSSKLTILADRGDVISLTSSQYFDGNQSFNQLTQTNTNDTYVIYSGSPATSTSTAISVVWA
jgi:Ca2+-binding RTX toxin-like protein